MKKTVKQWLLPLTLAAAALAGWAFFGPPPPPYTPVLTAQQTSNLHEYTYSVTSLPQASGIRILLHHGDGTFFMGSPSQLSSHSHIYPPGGSYLAFAEVVPLYDDDDNPKRTALQTITTGSSTSSFSANPINLNGKKVLLDRDADAVPGDSITYIVTCENTGRCQTQTANATLAFTFDANVFDYIRTDGYPALTPTSNSSSGATTVTTPVFTLAPSEQKSFFFLLETKTGLTLNTALAVNPSVVFNIKSGTCEDTESDVITGQLVKSAHDPNYKAALAPNNMCGNSVTWRVHFQNEGSAAAKLVIIKDWIDPLLDYGTVRVTNNNLGLSYINPTPLATERAYKIVLHPLNLKGTHQTPRPREDETKGYIELTANKQTTQPCNAVVNRAQIRFDNNPPIETNAEITPFPCTGICDTCTQALNLTLPIQQGLPDSSFLLPPSVTSTSWYNTLNNSTVYKKWYPTDGLDNPFALNPRILKQVNREYVLVASSSPPSSCTRWIVKVPVKPNCTLGLAVQQTQNGTSAACTKNVTANAAGQSPQYLLWNTGEEGVSSPQMRPNLIPQILYVAVWDTVTGCAQERWVKITDCNTPPSNNWWWILMVSGLLAIIGVLLVRIFSSQTRNTFP